MDDAPIGTSEQLTGGPGRASRWSVVVVPLALVALLAVWADQHAVDSAHSELARARASIAETARAGAGEVAGMVAYAGPSLTSATVGEDVRSDLVLLVRSAADRAAEETARQVPPMPLAARWHPDLADEWEQVSAEATRAADSLRAIGQQYSLTGR